MRVKMKHPPPTDYYNLFVIGVIWMALGIFAVFRGEPSISVFFIIGIVFTGIGWAHKKDWKKNRRTWKDLEPIEQKVKTWIIIILGVLALAGLVFFLLQ
jgi:drug/metabolite transporter (DMT)-like permease